MTKLKHKLKHVVVLTNPLTQQLCYAAGTRYILVCFLISTSRTEHTRRFLERGTPFTCFSGTKVRILTQKVLLGAMLRNAGLLMSAKRCFLMATSVLEVWSTFVPVKQVN